MLRFGSRFSAAVIVLALAAGRPALCAGWMPTPEARMACCKDGEACPMHRSNGHSPVPVTQPQADSCCAVSEGHDQARSSSFVLSMAVNDRPIPALSQAQALPVPRDAWRTVMPLPGAHVARHLLLSVFLV